jgi:hypothetical protein
MMRATLRLKMLGPLSLALCVFLATVLGPARVAAQSNPADYTYGDCTRMNREALRGEIEVSALAVLQTESGGLDIPALVAQKWGDLAVDGVLEAVVTQAVNQLANQESYLDRLWSGWSAEKAEEFATQIADQAFGSPLFRKKIEELSTAIAADIAREIEADFARAASAAFLCMKAYIGAQYSVTLFAAFEQKLSLEVEKVNFTDEASVELSVVDMHNKALGGVGLIVVSEIARRIAQKLGQKIAERIAGRIAGRVLGRAGSSFIPIAGWVIGLGLIVWDLWEGAQGALPQIQEALTSEEVKEKIRSEIADSIQNELPNESAVVALEIAVSMIEQWESFCVRQQNLCTVTEQSPTLQAILDATPLDQLDKLALLVDSFVHYAGQAELESALSSGQFERALALPAESFVILQSSKSVSTLLAWSALAGEQLNKVVTFGIYRQKEPADFDANRLNAVLSVNDQATIDRLLALNGRQLAQLYAFAGAELGSVAANLSLEELRELVAYLSTPPAGTPTPAADLAPKLAKREVTVRELVNPPLAPAETPARVLIANEPAPVVAERPFYQSAIFVAVGGLIVLLVGGLGIVGWRTRYMRKAKER